MRRYERYDNSGIEEKRTCNVCDGRGEVTCPTCSGMGQYWVNMWITCGTCNGRGRVKCTQCDGSGKVLVYKGHYL